MKKAPEDLDIKAVAKKLKWPTKKWNGKCYAVACSIVEAGIIKGRPAYGHYTGPVAKTGYWAERRGQMFQRHGWIVLKDGRILDPTRWSFEDKEPYFHIHDCGDHHDLCHCDHVRDEHKSGFFNSCQIDGCGCADFEEVKCDYDEGGNAIRALMQKPVPVYREPGPEADQYEKNRLKHVALKLKPMTRVFLLGLLNDPPAFTWEMVHWVANLSPKELGPHAKGVFKAIVDSGCGCSIPVDNRNLVLGE